MDTTLFRVGNQGRLNGLQSGGILNHSGVAGLRNKNNQQHFPISMASTSVSSMNAQHSWSNGGDHHFENASSAFLGPVGGMWGGEKNSAFDSNLSAAAVAAANGHHGDFKLEYMDLDEFLCENGLNSSTGGAAAAAAAVAGASATSLLERHLHAGNSSSSSSPTSATPGEENKVSSTTGGGKDRNSPNSKLKVDFELSPADLHLASIPGEPTFDPRKRRFSEEELKPQPMIKKSKKTFVPDDMKDEKYWSRRRKNNIAAKKSRDARRVKENQIAIRASYLEKENTKLRDLVSRIINDFQEIRERCRCIKFDPTDFEFKYRVPSPNNVDNNVAMAAAIAATAGVDIRSIDLSQIDEDRDSMSE